MQLSLPISEYWESYLETKAVLVDPGCVLRCTRGSGTPASRAGVTSISPAERGTAAAFVPKHVCGRSVFYLRTRRYVIVLSVSFSAQHMMILKLKMFTRCVLRRQRIAEPGERWESWPGTLGSPFRIRVDVSATRIHV